MRKPASLFRHAVAGALVLFLAACSTAAPVGSRAYPTAAPRAIFVSRGETAYDISRRYNVPLRDLIEENRLQPPYTLRPGQRLLLPVPLEYTVQSGDTIYGLSRRFELDMNELVRMNGISPPYMIRTGQVLRLPGGRSGDSRTLVAEAPQAAPRAVVQSAPVQSAPIQSAPVQTAPVQSAPAATPPTVSRPASRGVETAELPPMAGSNEPSPPAAQPRPTPEPQTAPRQTPSQPVPTAPTTRTVGPKPEPEPTPPPAPAEQQAAVVPVPAPPPVRSAAPEQVTPPKPAPRQGKRFLWPVQGPILSDFGPKPGGLYNDGINIGAEQGAPVQAAENGVVVYAGNELKGYGNLILVRHADGWLTAYAHLDRMEVDRGQEIRRGQRIGTVGRTGNVRSPQLHFGIRRNEKAMDPKDHLELPAS